MGIVEELVEIWPNEVCDTSAIWCPFFPQSLHVRYNTITSPLLYSSSNKSAFSGTPSPQCLNALCCRVFSGLFLHSSCCTFCEFIICIAFSFSSLLLGQSLHWCPMPSYLKHLIPFSCVFLLMEYASSFFGGTSCGTATHTTLFLLSFLFLRHSFYQCPSSLLSKEYAGMSWMTLKVLD